MEKISVGIIGISGYTGLELIKILLRHEYFDLQILSNTSGDSNLWDIYPSLYKVAPNMPIIKTNAHDFKDTQLVFLALPHMQSMQVAPEILQYGAKIVDLSADYRLEEANFVANYGTHTDSKNLKNAVYGLVEWNRENIKNAALIANPGCYPTASLLGILPFLQYINGSVFIDAKSGVSGAGKKLTHNTHYTTINDNIFAYSPLSHRHQIEIREKCQYFGKRDVKINFIPHLSPFTRGMLVSIFARLEKPIDAESILQNAYKDEPFIRIRNEPVDVKSVAGGHFCDIFVKTSDEDIFINTSIDNLLRGASSQAIACANLMFGIPESHALPTISYVP